MPRTTSTHTSLISARREAIQLSQAGYTAQEKNSMSHVMQPKYKLLPDGGFVAGDPATGVTSYAYPTSIYATQARKQEPVSVARAMLAMEGMAFRVSPSIKEYDSRNWEMLNK